MSRIWRIARITCSEHSESIRVIRFISVIRVNLSTRSEGVVPTVRPGLPDYAQLHRYCALSRPRRGVRDKNPSEG